jgi:hypothetical protein
MTKIFSLPGIENSTWEQRARAAVRMTDATSRYFAMRTARTAYQHHLFRQCRILARGYVSACAVKRLYEAARTSRWDAVAPLGMSPA